MKGLMDLFSTIQQVRGFLNDLSRDVDTNSPREETKEDLKKVHSGFENLGQIFSSIDTNDINNILTEVTEFTSGKQTFQEYVRDIGGIVNEIRAKTEADPAIKEKLEKNLPSKIKGKDPVSALGEWQKVLNNIMGAR